jgi:hypothetical protein
MMMLDGDDDYEGRRSKVLLNCIQAIACKHLHMSKRMYILLYLVAFGWFIEHAKKRL